MVASSDCYSVATMAALMAGHWVERKVVRKVERSVVWSAASKAVNLVET
jgi:hypothetical protein